MQVRPARVEEAGEIAQIHVRTWQVAYPGIVPAAYLASLSIEKYEAMWHGSIVKGAPQVLVAAEASGIVGWVAFDRSRDEAAAADVAEIWAIYVSAAHWGRGAGGRLWLEARERMRAQGFTSVGLWAFPENLRAGRFYRSLGFEVEAGSSRCFGTP